MRMALSPLAATSLTVLLLLFLMLPLLLWPRLLLPPCSSASVSGRLPERAKFGPARRRRSDGAMLFSKDQLLWALSPNEAQHHRPSCLGRRT